MSFSRPGRRCLRSDTVNYFSALLATACLVLTSCGASSEDSSEGSVETTEAAAVETTVTTQETAETTTLTTPTPSDEEAAAIEAGVAGIYPDVPEGKAVDWSRSLCRYVLEGNEGDQLTNFATQMFAGGDRPDPTPEQANAIVALVQNSSWCVA